MLFPNNRCFVIAEIAQSHDGSLGMAHAYIDAVAEAGADAVKFQTHIAEAESTPLEPWRVRFSLQDESRYDYWKRMEFTPEQWEGLAAHARDKGILFMSTPFSLEAVDLLEKLNITYWKVGSGEITNAQLIKRMARTGIPVLLSTGMCTLEELDRCVGWIKDEKAKLLIMQCTSSYPCPPEKVGLNMLPFYKDRYKCPVGLSDHSGTIFPGILAAALGAEAVEIHVTFSRQMFGPDITSSLTIEELKQLVEGIRFAERVMGSQVDKNEMARQFSNIRDIFFKCLVALKDLEPGTIISEDLIGAKKAGYGGIPAHLIEVFIGRRLRRPVKCNEQFREEDFDSE